jgi:hypothetical protein
MGKNSYLEKQKAVYQGMLDAGMDMGFQKCWDLVQLVLRDPEFMGKDTFGKERIKRFYKGLVKYEHIFGVALTGSVDADYFQEKLDINLREIWGDELCPFEDRYPYIKQPNYTKGKKEWKK